MIPAFTDHVNLPLLGGGVMGSALVGVGFYADPETLKEPEISSGRGFSAVRPGNS